MSSNQSSSSPTNKDGERKKVVISQEARYFPVSAGESHASLDLHVGVFGDTNKQGSSSSVNKNDSSSNAVESFLPDASSETAKDSVFSTSRSNGLSSQVSFLLGDNHKDHTNDQEQENVEVINGDPLLPQQHKTAIGLRDSVSTHLAVIEENESCSLSPLKRFYLYGFFIPCLFTTWFAAAILFPPGARDKASLLLWDDGQLSMYDSDGKNRPTLCPRSSICSEGILQLLLIAIARLTAFASYVFMSVVFLSKMHFTIRFLSRSYLRKIIPFEELHHIHTKAAKIFGLLIGAHVVTHYIRYILRSDVDQLGTKVHVSGLLGTLSMVVLIVGMSSFVKNRKNFAISKFEVRFSLHWVGVIVLGVSMLIHTPRSRVVMLILLGMWALDYLYGIVFGTYNLQVVELLPLPNQSGLQMLWHNPPGFRPRSGEYVKIQMPWLSKGRNEWHPFSIYLRESTKAGFKHVFDADSDSMRNLVTSGSRADIEAHNLNCLSNFIHTIMMTEFQYETMSSKHVSVMEEARGNIHDQYDTTQVFICPVGDWSKNLMQELHDQKQLRACWVRGPFTSPYHVAQNFSHLVLTATGIGITPSLGVMGQYPGFSRTKILIWSVRDKNMLKFFAPLVTDAHLAVIYYTGKEKLDEFEVKNIRRNGNIFLQQSRPKSFHGTVELALVEFENHINLSTAETIKDLDMRKKKAWCVLYCGGSVRIRDDLKDFAKDNGVGFESELFDW